MSLLLTVYNTPAWKALADASNLLSIIDAPLELTAGDALVQSVQSLSALPALLLQLPAGQTLWIAAVQAELFLANAIEAGNDLKEAALQWEQQTRALLTLQSQKRRQLKLFNLHQALAQPRAFRDGLGESIKIDDYPPQPVSDSLALLAACHYVTQQPGLQSLNNRLHASLLPLVDSAALLLDIPLILQRHRGNAAQLTAITEERDLVLSQLHQVQEQLEIYYVNMRTEKQNNEQLSQLLQGEQQNTERLTLLLQAEKQNTEQARLALEAEQQQSKHTLLAHDKQHARAMAKLEGELRKTKAQAASAEYAGFLLQQELAKVKNSTSWKASSPVRAFGRFIKRTDKEDKKLLQDTALLLTSEYFDIEWYLRLYPDVADSKLNPAEHYLLYGAAEGRLPGPLFDGNWYLQHYPDVAKTGANPLLHFIMFGQQEGRSSSPKLLTNDSSGAEE